MDDVEQHKHNSLFLSFQLLHSSSFCSDYGWEIFLEFIYVFRCVLILFQQLFTESYRWNDRIISFTEQSRKSHSLNTAKWNFEYLMNSANPPNQRNLHWNEIASSAKIRQNTEWSKPFFISFSILNLHKLCDKGSF